MPTRSAARIAITCLILSLAGLAGCAGTSTTMDPTPTLSMTWVPQDSGSTVSLRGLSAVDDRVAWASGADGTCLRTLNGGRTWEKLPVIGAESLDFRDIQAFSSRRALLLSAGEPARIYRTTNGGSTWKNVYANDTPGVFFDGMAFWDDDRGVAFSDPIDGIFLVITTEDGGRTWTPVPAAHLPVALPNEAGFAASGTGICVVEGGFAWIGLGGDTEADGARILRSTDYGNSWTVHTTPLPTSASAGIFSMVFMDNRHGVIIGGDYQNEMVADRNAAVTSDGGTTWIVSHGMPSGYRSVVVRLSGDRLLCAGPSGVDGSVDGGLNWVPMHDIGYHTMSASPKGGGVWAAGADGRIGWSSGR